MDITSWVARVEAVKQECTANDYDFIVAVANGDANRQFEQINNFVSLIRPLNVPCLTKY